MPELSRSYNLEPVPWNSAWRLQCEQDDGGIQYGAFSPGSGPLAVHVSLGFRRVLDNDEKNAPGQDYAVVVSDGDYVVGVVADGVAQSFYGNIAAKYVSNWLAGHLWNARTLPPDEGRLGDLLREAQTACEKSDIRDISLGHLPELLQKALESTRTSGSQAVFVAYVWNLTQRQLTLYQVGDAIAIVHTSDNDPEVVEGIKKGRWSTAGKSDLHLSRTNYGPNVTGIVIKSDGPALSWGQDAPENQVANQARFEAMASERAAKDDVSFVASWLGVPPRKSRVALAYQPIYLEEKSTFETTAGQAIPTPPSPSRVDLQHPRPSRQTPSAVPQNFAGRPPTGPRQPTNQPANSFSTTPRASLQLPGRPEYNQSGPMYTDLQGNAPASRTKLGLSLLFVLVAFAAGFAGWFIGSSSRPPSSPDSTQPDQHPDADTPRIAFLDQMQHPWQDPNAKKLLEAANADRNDVIVHLAVQNGSCCTVSVAQDLKVDFLSVTRGEWYLLVENLPAGKTTRLKVNITSRDGRRIQEEKIDLRPIPVTTEPQTNPGASPEKKPAKKPAASPEKKPAASPEKKPAASPEKKPAASPEKKPAASPEKEPAASPEKKPAASPE